MVLNTDVAISYKKKQLRTERAYRSVTNLEKQLSFFLGDSFTAARRRLAEARVHKDELLPWSVDDPPIEAFEVLDFYDHMGLLVRKGHLEVFDVWHTFYEWAQPVYVDLRALVEDENSEYFDHYSELRTLIRAMDDIQLKRMHEKNGNHWALWTPERISDYYRYESEAKQGTRRRRKLRDRAEERAESGIVDSEGAPISSETVVKIN